jgi:uncharacterized protein
MNRILKYLFLSVISILLLLGILIAGFIYKIKYGFPVSFETEIPEIDFPANQKAVLLFSKTTGFRHGESITASKSTFQELAGKHNWFLYSTEEGGVFNAEQLSKFDVVVFNNSTGRVLNDEQQKNLEEYVDNGGKLIGIHGAGDDSHHWSWYEQNLLGAKFSHHPIDPQFQPAEISLQSVPDSSILIGLSHKWEHTDEWYIFFENPREKGFNILYTINGDKIIPNGNILWVKDKNFGMGIDHPVAWYRTTGKGKTFYTSIGHDASAWRQEAFIQMLGKAVEW